MWRNPISTDFIYCLKYIKGCIVFQVDPLFLTLGFIQKIFPHFIWEKLSYTPRILTIFLEDFKTSLSFQITQFYVLRVVVVGLHPNIPIEEGLLFLKKALEKRRNKTLSTESPIEVVELVLGNNYFDFNDRFRKQKEGTAIGTKFAPPYAIIFMAALDEEILEYLIKKACL